jgi:hypothetical protein
MPFLVYQENHLLMDKQFLTIPNTMSIGRGMNAITTEDPGATTGLVALSRGGLLHQVSSLLLPHP